MERFGYSSSNISSYSDIGDRYGFDRSLFSSEDFHNDKKPTFKIHVSSTGKVEETLLFSSEKSEQEPPRYSNDVINIKDLEAALATPWMKDYKHLGDCLLHALRKDPFTMKETDNKDTVSSVPEQVNNSYEIPIPDECELAFIQTKEFEGEDFPPYFISSQGKLVSIKNRCDVHKKNHVDAYLVLGEERPLPAMLPIKGHTKDFEAIILQYAEWDHDYDYEILAYVEAHLDVDGKVTFGKLFNPDKNVSWDDKDYYAIHMIFDLDTSPDEKVENAKTST